MDLNWYAAEMLMKQKNTEIEKIARESWKWTEAKQNQSSRFFRRRQVIPAMPMVCCTTACC